MTAPSPPVFSQRHLLGIDHLSREEIVALLDLADEAVTISRQVEKKRATLRGRTQINLFFEASTRTQSSFELAGKRLGADVMNMAVAASSVKKGETLIDTAMTLNAMRPDILVVRHASTCALGSAGCDTNAVGDPYFQASGCNSATELASGNIATYYVLDTNAASFTLHQKDCVTLANVYQYRTHIYFVANNDQAGDGIPTLKRAELGVTLGVLTFNIVPLVEGIENMQIEYGLDTSVPTTGSPAVYTTDPDSYVPCAASPTNCWRNTVAAKINVLARNTTITQGYADGKVYTLGLQFDGLTPNTVGPFNDAYKRHAYESVVKLNNPAGRNSP